MHIFIRFNGLFSISFVKNEKMHILNEIYTAIDRACIDLLEYYH